MSEVLGEQTSALVRDAENRIEQAQQDKWKAITAYLEGAGIDRQVVDTQEMPDGQIMVEFAEDEQLDEDDEASE